MKVNNILKKLDRFDQIYLISHINPDGDSIGSLLALGKSLKYEYNDRVMLLKSDTVPEKFEFLEDTKLLSDLDILRNIPENSVLITLDCGDIYRIGEAYKYIKDFKTIINIDHHVSNNKFGDINIVEPKSSSTGEIVYDIIFKNDFTIDKEIASALYIAISTDTGSFKYESANSKTYRIAANLLEYGIDKTKIIIEVYQNRSIEKTNAFIEGLKNLSFSENNKVAITVVSKKMLEKINSKPEDVDGIVEFIRDTEGVEVSCVIKEIENCKFKISLRSKSYLDVSDLANVFGGGGHKRASGIIMEGNISNIKEKLIFEIRKRLRC